MKIEDFDTDERVFVVAEIGNNHEGDFALAQEMIGRAAEVGVDAVKFQTFKPERYVSVNDPERLDRLRAFELDYAQFQALSELAAQSGVLFFSTPFDIESAFFLNALQPVFKISSGDNTFLPLIDEVAGFGKPTIISTGLVDLDHLDLLNRRWSEKKTGHAELAFLHCVSSYPVPIEQANLKAIATLQARFPSATIGYSDHTIGIEAAIVSVALGARIVEKHFTVDHDYSDFRDHQLSADPEEMKILVDRIRHTELLLGSGIKEPQPSENAARAAVRRSISAMRSLPAGTTLSLDDLTWLRPGDGIPAGNEIEVVGMVLKRSLQKGETIHPEMLSP